jgi:hypothetical protein
MQNKIIELLKERYPQAPVDWGKLGKCKTGASFRKALLRTATNDCDPIFRYVVSEILDTWAEAHEEKMKEADFWHLCFVRVHQSIEDMQSVLGGLAGLASDPPVVGPLNKRGKADL